MPAGTLIGDVGGPVLPTINVGGPALVPPSPPVDVERITTSLDTRITTQGDIRIIA